MAILHGPSATTCAACRIPRILYRLAERPADMTRFQQTAPVLHYRLVLSRCEYLRRVDVNPDQQALRQCPLIGLTEIGETTVDTTGGRGRHAFGHTSSALAR